MDASQDMVKSCKSGDEIDLDAVAKLSPVGKGF